MVEAEPASIPLPKSPLVRVNSLPLPTDSMVSISLSEPLPETISEEDNERSSVQSDVTIEPPRDSLNRRSSIQIFHGVDLEAEINGPRTCHNADDAIESSEDANESQVEAAAAALEGKSRSRRETQGSSSSSQESLEDDSPVDWEELEKNEECEPRDEASDEVCVI